MTIQENVKRRTSRTRVLMTGMVITRDGSHQVLLRDISSTGAQVSADTKFTEGHDVCFRRGPIFVAAHIAWCKKGVAGLRFYRELSDSERASAFHSVVLVESGE